MIPQNLLDLFGYCLGNSRNLFEILPGHVLKIFHTSELLQQELPSFGTHSWNGVQGGCQQFMAMNLLIVGDGKAVRFVSQPLQQVENLWKTGQDARVFAPRNIDLFVKPPAFFTPVRFSFLGDGNEGKLFKHAKILHEAVDAVQLSFAPVQNQEIQACRKVGFFTEEPFYHFSHHGRIIGFVLSFNAVTPVGALVGLTMVEHDDSPYRMAPLNIGDVYTSHAKRNTGSFKNALHAFQQTLIALLHAPPGGESLPGILLRQVQELPAVSPFDRPDADTLSPEFAQPFAKHFFGFNGGGNQNFIGDVASFCIILLDESRENFFRFSLGFLDVEVFLTDNDSLADEEHRQFRSVGFW